jgi:quercetin dioxygenase-like cupin family protein
MNYNKELEGVFEINPEVGHTFADGLYSKQMIIPKGFVAGMHKHHYSHLSILAKGRVKITTEDYNKEVTAPFCITIEAEKNHSIEALEDSVWFCIHATDETENVDDFLIYRS